MKKRVWLIAGGIVLFTIALIYHHPVWGQTPPAKTPELLNRGKKLFAEKCASCHGSNGNAQTSMAKILKPPPRDFTQPVKDWAVSQGDPVKIYKVIKEGVPNSGMVKFALPDQDIWALVYTVTEFGK